MYQQPKRKLMQLLVHTQLQQQLEQFQVQEQQLGHHKQLVTHAYFQQQLKETLLQLR